MFLMRGGFETKGIAQGFQIPYVRIYWQLINFGKLAILKNCQLLGYMCQCLKCNHMARPCLSMHDYFKSTSCKFTKLKLDHQYTKFHQISSPPINPVVNTNEDL